MLSPSMPLRMARPLPSSSRHDRAVVVVDARDRPIVVVAVAVDVGADRLVDRVARVVPEDRARRSGRRHGVDVDARDEGVPVVEVRAPVVVARVQIVRDARRCSAGACGTTSLDVGQRVGDPAAPAVREPLLERELQRIEVGVAGRRASGTAARAGSSRPARDGRNELAVRIERVGRQPRRCGRSAPGGPSLMSICAVWSRPRLPT